MWKALVIICSLNTSDCLKLDDTRGPYDEKAKCQARVSEMALGGQKIMASYFKVPGPYKVKANCSQIGEQA